MVLRDGEGDAPTRIALSVVGGRLTLSARPAGRPRYGPACLWPMIVFLHGRSESGSDVGRFKRQGILCVVHEADDFSFVAISLQVPGGTDWAAHHSTLVAFLSGFSAASSMTRSLSVSIAVSTLCSILRVPPRIR